MAKKVCNFCGRSENEVKLLITGLNGYICENCAEQAHDIVVSTGLLNGNKDLQGDKPFKLKKVPKPREIKKHLDEYVIGQDEAKRFLSVAVYNHYKRLQQPLSDKGVEIEKSNIIMVGSTGTARPCWPEPSPNSSMFPSPSWMLQFLQRPAMWVKT